MISEKEESYGLTVSEALSLQIDDRIEDVNYVVDEGIDAANQLADKTIHEGTMAVSNAIGDMSKNLVDFTKSATETFADKSSSMIDKFKGTLKDEGISVEEGESLEISSEADKVSLNAPDVLQEGVDITLAEHSAEERLGLTRNDAGLTLSQKRTNEVQDAKVTQVSEPKVDRYSQCKSMVQDMDAKQAQMRQADDDFEETLMSRRMGKM